MNSPEKLKYIRNFCIISHIDHGKSTLADRFLELTNTVPASKMRSQYLDSMNLERERGITIKMHPVRMNYRYRNREYVLNLIDTPGHIDFSYEISRSLACVEGAILLVDAVKGVQAQTLFNLEMARSQGLKILGAVNKIDIAPKERIQESRRELAAILNQPESDIFLISAKTGEGVRELIEAVIKNIPSPQSRINQGNYARALVFDSKYDPFLGVVAFVRVFEGTFKKNEKIYFISQKTKNESKEVGYFRPQFQEVDTLSEGEIGYIKTGIKDASRVRVGDTIVKITFPDNEVEIQALPGYNEPSPVLYLTFYPENQDDFDLLYRAVQKIRLTDPSLRVQVYSQGVLGRGLRIGFLGSLQAEIIASRLKEEFGLRIISTFPQVVYKVVLKNGQQLEVSSAWQWPSHQQIAEILEPYASIEIIVPKDFLGGLFGLFERYEITLQESLVLASQKLLLRCRAPLRKIVSGAFYNALKSVTRGFASFAFEIDGFERAQLVKLDILVAGKKEDAFSRIVPESEAFSEAKEFLKKLKDVLPRQQFAVPLQGVIGGKIIARETIPAMRKDVTAPLYGGDVTRKMKLLEIQKKGKKKLAQRANIKVSPEVFLKILKSE